MESRNRSLRFFRTFVPLLMTLSLLLTPLATTQRIALAEPTRPERKPVVEPTPVLDGVDELVGDVQATTIDLTENNESNQHIPTAQIRAVLLDESLLSPDDVVRIRVTVEATGAVSVPTLRMALPDGFAQIDRDDVIVTVPLSSMEPGDVQEHELELWLTDAARDVNTLSIELWSVDAQGPVIAEVEVRRAFDSASAVIDPTQGGELHSDDARVTVTMPAGDAGESMRIEHHPIAVERLQGHGSGLALQFELKAYTEGESETPVQHFEKPLELRVDLTDLVDLLDLAYYQHPFLGYWDEESQEWVAVDARQQGNVLVAEVDHFSLWGTGTTVGADTGWMIPANEATVSLFDGAFTYGYPLQTPDCAGNIQPALSLNYNSRRLDGVVSWVQSDWVGMGWTLDTMEIVRDAFRPQYTDYPGGDPDFANGRVQWGNRFSLLFKGTRYPLIPSTPNARGRYHTEDDQFVYIERRNNFGSGTNGSTVNDTTEYWVVRTRDGTEYRLGHNEDSEQTFYTIYYNYWDLLYGDGDVPESYVGRHDGRVAYRWRVDHIEDLRGNRVQFSYDEEETCSGANFRENASYLDTISYNRDPQAQRWQTEIVFDRAARNGSGISDYGWDCDDAFLFQADYLTKIRVRNWNSSTSSMETLREYRFTYSEMAANGGNDKKVRLLDSITEYGRGAASSLPATSFDYAAYDSKVHCDACGDTWKEESYPYERLSEITNGYGLTTSISYDTPDQPDPSDTDYERVLNYRVQQVDTADSGGEGSRLAYSYTEANSERCYDNDSTPGCDFFASGVTSGGTLVGYKMVTETLQTDDVSPVDMSLAIHEFKLDSDASRDIRRGHELTTWQKSPGTPPTTLVKTVNDWQTAMSLDDTSGLRDFPVPECYFVYPEEVLEYWYEPDEPATPQIRTEYTYSMTLNTRLYRNEADYVHLGSVKSYDSGTLVRETASNYGVNLGLDASGVAPTGPWITDQLSEQLLKTGGGAVAARSRYIYDSQANTCTSTPTRGDLVRVEELRSGASDWIVSERMTHTLYTANSESFWYGPTQTSDANGNETDITYSTAWRLYPETSTNALAQVTTTSWDYVLGKPSYMQGPNGSDTRVTYTYDDFGRLEKVIEPYDSSGYPTTQYFYNDGAAPWSIRQEDRQTVGSADVIRTYRYYSGQGQLIQEREANTGQSSIIVNSQTYNTLGLLDKQYEPEQPGGYSTAYTAPSGYYTSYTYDALGRQRQVTKPDSMVTQTDYRGLRTAVIDANEHQTIQEMDGLGRIECSETYGGTFGSATWDATPYVTATYTYNASDQLTQVSITPDGEATYQTTMQYDLLGRKTQMSDPDMGTWLYAYDAEGNLIRQQDARGDVTYQYYDALNRLIGKDYCTGGCGQDPPNPPSYDVRYYYDCAVAGYGLGRLYYTEDVGAGITRSYRYDRRGRVDGSWLSIGGTDEFRTSWTYNSADQVVTQSYPGGNSYNWGETVTTSYDGFGRPYGLSGTSTYVSSVTYDAYDRTDVITFGNDYLTDYDYYAPTNDGGRVQWIKTGTSGDTTSIQWLLHTYDDVGNIHLLRDYNNGYQLTYYYYDALDRLLEALTTGYGADQYDHDYTYDGYGNMTSYAGTALGYDATHKHAVTTWGGETRYGYDANGNMTSRKWGSQGQEQTLTYDVENRLTTVVIDDTPPITNTFVYDAESLRVKGIVSGTTTCYMGDWYEWDGAAGEKYYYLGGRRVAMRTASSDVYFIHGDHLTTATNTTGAITTTQRYYPYGTRRSDTEVETPYRFTGQREESAIGLYFYNSRWYDPYVGRFIQPDTIIPEPGNPQAYNRYSYCLNNPVRYVDPTGRWLDEGAGYYYVPAKPQPSPWQEFTQPGVDVYKDNAPWAGGPVVEKYAPQRCHGRARV